MEYYSDIKRNELKSVLVIWVNIESVVWSEVSEREKILYNNEYIWDLEKWY